MDLKSKIILISGPTASGKSKFAIKLAKKIGGEIINADSMQIFKEIKILTARPSSKDRSSIKHHLYGFMSVKKNFSVGDWLKKCLKKISEINEAISASIKCNKPAVIDVDVDPKALYSFRRDSFKHREKK